MEDQYIRHGLIDGFNPIAHRKFIHYLLRHVVKVNLPGVITTGFWDFHHTLTEDICDVMKEVLRERIYMKLLVTRRRTVAVMQQIYACKCMSGRCCGDCALVVLFYLMQTGVLDMVGGHFLFTLNFDADLKTDGTRHSRLVRSFLCGVRYG